MKKLVKHQDNLGFQNIYTYNSNIITYLPGECTHMHTQIHSYTFTQFNTNHEFYFTLSYLCSHSSVHALPSTLSAYSCTHLSLSEHSSSASSPVPKPSSLSEASSTSSTPS